MCPIGSPAANESLSTGAPSEASWVHRLTRGDEFLRRGFYREAAGEYGRALPLAASPADRAKFAGGDRHAQRGRGGPAPIVPPSYTSFS